MSVGANSWQNMNICKVTKITWEDNSGLQLLGVLQKNSTKTQALPNTSYMYSCSSKQNASLSMYFLFVLLLLNLFHSINYRVVGLISSSFCPQVEVPRQVNEPQVATNDEASV